MTENSVATTIDWTSLSGTILDGGCELKDVIEVRDEAAKLRVRILGSGGRTGTAYFLHLDGKDAADQLEIWEVLRDSPHPNLNRPLSVGKRQVNGTDVVYCVLADPDEKLAVVIPERPLEWEEAGEVLQSVEKALAHLHSKGLLHGSVSPDTVQAVGYTIQLDTEGVRKIGKPAKFVWSKPRYLAPESKTANNTVAADVWCLGATLFEVLAQESYGTPGAELEKGMPLGGVIKRCLEKDPANRAKLRDAQAFESGPAAPAVPQQAPPPKAPVSAPVVVLPAEAPKVQAPEVKSAPPISDKPAADKVTSPVPSAEKPSVPKPAPSRLVEEKILPVGPAPQPRAGTPISRLPQPLTPPHDTAIPLPPKPRLVTKEDMALVPVGKRHKKVQGKRVGVDARIRTLDGPVREGYDDGAATTRPTVVARILAVGKGSNFVRGIVAGVLLAGLLVAAIWLIIIPKLSTPVDPLVTADATQTVANGVTPPPPMPVPTPQGPFSVPDTTNQKPSADKPSEPAFGSDNSMPIAPVRASLYRVVVGYSDSRTDAATQMEKLSAQHPELFFHLATSKIPLPGKRYMVLVGGVLNENEASQLLKRIMSKGVKGAEVLPYNR
jgi:hypothetical protein